MRKPQVAGCLLLTLILSANAVAQTYPPAMPSQRNVEIVVDSSLYATGEITESLAQYVRDLTCQGYAPTVTTTAFSSATQLRAHLADRYVTDGLAGAVFVGDLPKAWYEIASHGSWAYESFPIDLYFQDLDGAWTDGDSDGNYDDHTGETAPEIWLGRMVTSKLTSLHSGRTEASLLNDYFAKNHAYRRGDLATSTDGLAYVDDDWIPWSTSWASNLQAAVSGEVTLVNTSSGTNAADYESRLANESYEHLLVCVHSNSSYHAFEGGGGGNTHNSEIQGLNPDILFYNLFACSNARFTSNGYMAGEYVFGTDAGLLSVGSTKTGAMQQFYQYYNPLGDGEVFGDAWQAWFDAIAAYGFSASEKDWYYGMTMVGDPLLATQAYQDFLVWADFDQDGDADADDIDILCANIGGADPRYDVDGDGDCDSDDLVLLIENLVEWSESVSGEQGVGTACGDFNLDGLVNATDLAIMQGGFGLGSQGYADGNGNGDSLVDATDLAILAANFGYVAPTGPVPEPVTIGLLSMGGMALLRRRRRK